MFLPLIVLSMTHLLCSVYLFTLLVIDVWPKENQVTEGKKVVINCSQSSNNSNITGLNFTWSKLGTDTLLSNSSQLTITNIRRGDSGNYSCTATNGTANWSAVAIASITVLCKYTFSSLSVRCCCCCCCCYYSPRFAWPVSTTPSSLN